MSALCLNRCCVAPAVLLELLLPLPLWLGSPLPHSHTKVLVVTATHHLPLPGKCGLGPQALASAPQSVLRFATGGRLLDGREVSHLRGEGLLSRGCLSGATPLPGQRQRQGGIQVSVLQAGDLLFPEGFCPGPWEEDETLRCALLPMAGERRATLPLPRHLIT